MSLPQTEDKQNCDSCSLTVPTCGHKRKQHEFCCAQSGRQFIGFDISEDFFKIAQGRLKEESMPKINGLQFQTSQSQLVSTVGVK
jgi:hypothetical protein